LKNKAFKTLLSNVIKLIKHQLPSALADGKKQTHEIGLSQTIILAKANFELPFLSSLLMGEAMKTSCQNK
jgi:hypothetical protein